MERIERYSSIRELFEQEVMPLGMLTGSTDPAIIEILGHSGFDFVAIDCEHGPIGREIANNLFRAAEANGLLGLARVADNNPLLISEMLDCGARGIVVPHINNAEDVQNAIIATKYSPYGPRGWCPNCRNAKYSISYWTKYSSIINENTCIIPLIESQKAIDNIDEIFLIPEIDVVFFGPGDLSHELGLVGQGLKSSQIVKAMERVIFAGKKANKKVIGFPFPIMDIESARLCLDKGFDAICFGMDFLLFYDTCRNISKSLKSINKQ